MPPRPVGRGALASAGVFAFVFAFAVPLVGASHPREPHPVSVAGTSDVPGIQGVARAARRVRDVPQPEAVAGFEAPPDLKLAKPLEPSPEPTPVARSTPSPKPPAPQPAVAAFAAPSTGGVVIASWYGPGFYGNRTACGQIYTPEIVGVAHRTLPCGTLVTIEYRGRTLTAPVIDRGPYIAGRTLDLSNATRLAMACPDLCTVSMRIGP